MTFEYAERRRCIEIIHSEWAKGDGIVKTEDVYERLKAEGINPPPGAMDALLTSLDQQGLIKVARMLGRDAIAQHGNMWLTQVTERTPEELRNFAAILRSIRRGDTNMDAAQARVQVEIPELAPLTRELARTRNVNLRIAFIQMLLTIISWLLTTQNVVVHDLDVNIESDINITVQQDHSP